MRHILKIFKPKNWLYVGGKVFQALRVFMSRLGIGLLANDRKLLRLKNKHLQQRCFIVGNGPSVRIQDLEKLHVAKEKCFGVNRVYRAFDDTSWRPDYYCVEDIPIIDGSFDSINAMQGFTRLLLKHPDLKNQKDVIWFDRKATTYDQPPEFDFSPIPHFFCGQTVIYICIQFAVYMGFTEIILLGVDLSWDTIPDEQMNKDGKSEIPDNYDNNFIKNYKNTGERHYQVTEGLISYIMSAMLLANSSAESRGVTILNATRGGKLEVFERVAFDELIGNVKQSL